MITAVVQSERECSAKRSKPKPKLKLKNKTGSQVVNSAYGYIVNSKLASDKQTVWPCLKAKHNKIIKVRIAELKDRQEDLPDMRKTLSFRFL